MDFQKGKGILNRSAAERYINRYFKKRAADAKKNNVVQRPGALNKLKEDMFTFVDYLETHVETQQKEKETMRLDISDNAVSEATGLTERRVKTIRDIFNEMKMIWFPEYSRPKKKGDYPIWLLSTNVITWVFEGSTKRKRIDRREKYSPFYYHMRDHFRVDLFHDLKSYNTSMDTGMFIATSYINLNNHLAEYGLCKEDFLKTNDYAAAEAKYYKARHMEFISEQEFKERAIEAQMIFNGTLEVKDSKFYYELAA